MIPPRLKITNAKQGEISLSNFPSPLCAEIEDMWQATMEHIDDGNNEEALKFCVRTINKLAELGMSL